MSSLMIEALNEIRKRGVAIAGWWPVLALAALFVAGWVLLS